MVSAAGIHNCANVGFNRHWGQPAIAIYNEKLTCNHNDRTHSFLALHRLCLRAWPGSKAS